jgi:hypothetical protein
MFLLKEYPFLRQTSSRRFSREQRLFRYFLVMRVIEIIKIFIIFFLKLAKYVAFFIKKRFIQLKDINVFQILIVEYTVHVYVYSII